MNSYLEYQAFGAPEIEDDISLHPEMPVIDLLSSLSIFHCLISQLKFYNQNAI